MTKQEVLDKCRIENNVVFLPDVQLDRPLYMQVNKALQGAGGKWNKKAKGFVFSQDPSDVLGRVKSGEKVNLKKEFQAFYTPDIVASEISKIVPKTGTPRVLEPSAGDGALVDAVLFQNPNAVIDMIEINDLAFNGLLEKYTDKSQLNFYKADFLGWADHYAQNDEFDPEYDIIVANPPFTKNQDIKHFMAMYDLLKVGGTMSVIMSTGWIRNSTRVPTEFRKWLGMDTKNENWVDKINRNLSAAGGGSYQGKRSNGTWGPTALDQVDIKTFEAGTFKESGTNVITCVVTIKKGH